MASIKLPLIETAKVNSIKLPLKETAWVISGFIIRENIIEWKKKELIILENIRSRINFDVVLIDKNHIKIKWFGDPVPKIQIFRALETEEFGTQPFITLPWSPQEYTMLIDSNSYKIKMVGINNTGLSDSIVLGSDQNNEIDVNLEMPQNEKNYFIDVDLTSTYRIEVDL